MAITFIALLTFCSTYWITDWFCNETCFPIYSWAIFKWKKGSFGKSQQSCLDEGCYNSCWLWQIFSWILGGSFLGRLFRFLFIYLVLLKKKLLEDWVYCQTFFFFFRNFVKFFFFLKSNFFYVRYFLIVRKNKRYYFFNYSQLEKHCLVVCGLFQFFCFVFCAFIVKDILSFLLICIPLFDF